MSLRSWEDEDADRGRWWSFVGGVEGEEVDQGAKAGAMAGEMVVRGKAGVSEQGVEMS